MKIYDITGPVREGIWKYGDMYPDYRPVGASAEPGKCFFEIFDGFNSQTGTYLETAAHITGFVEAISEKNALKLTYLLVPMEKSKRDVLLPVLNQWLELVQGALSCRAGLPAVSQMARNLSLSRTPQELMKIAGHLKKAIEYTQSNVSTAAVCGFLEWALR